jgi:hypothetical protein
MRWRFSTTVAVALLHGATAPYLREADQGCGGTWGAARWSGVVARGSIDFAALNLSRSSDLAVGSRSVRSCGSTSGDRGPPLRPLSPAGCLGPATATTASGGGWGPWLLSSAWRGSLARWIPKVCGRQLQSRMHKGDPTGQLLECSSF